MYKIPDDSVVEEEIPVKSYFKSKNVVSLDQTVRNHGRSDVSSSSAKAALSSSSFVIPSASSSSLATPSLSSSSSAIPSLSSSSSAIPSASSRSFAKHSASLSSTDTGNNGKNGSTVTDVNRAETQSNINVAAQHEDNAEKNALTHKNAINPGAKSLSDAFSYIKDTEFYNEKDTEKAVQENRKRKIVESKNNDKPESPKKSEISQNSSAAVIVSTRQRGNPLLPHMRNVIVTYRDDILPDYVLGANTCAIFLSLKYHRLHPDYIYERLRQLGKGFIVRILLLQVDIPDSAICIQELTKVALLSSLTLMLAWSPVEAARYLEAFKIYENKPPEVLQGVKDTSYQGHLNGFLTSIRGVNKTDVARLKSEFGTVKDIVQADKGKLSALPGIGGKKAGRIHELFRQPFRNSK